MADSNVEQNKDVYRRYIQEIFNDAHLEKLDEFLAPDYVYRDAPPGTPPGKEAIREVVTLFHKAFPDVEITLDDIVAEGEKVCVRSTTRGTHQGEFMGVAPTGKSVIMLGMTMVRIVDGKLVESWVKNDVMSLMKQLSPGSPES